MRDGAKAEQCVRSGFVFCIDALLVQAVQRERLLAGVLGAAVDDAVESLTASQPEHLPKVIGRELSRDTTDMLAAIMVDGLRDVLGRRRGETAAWR